MRCTGRGCASRRSIQNLALSLAPRRGDWPARHPDPPSVILSEAKLVLSPAEGNLAPREATSVSITRYSGGLQSLLGAENRVATDP